MTHCTICSAPCPGWDWRDTAWCADCYDTHIQPGLLGLVRPPAPVLTATERTRLDGWLAALGVATEEEADA
jgi:hypothetical protein